MKNKKICALLEFFCVFYEKNVITFNILKGDIAYLDSPCDKIRQIWCKTETTKTVKMNPILKKYLCSYIYSSRSEGPKPSQCCAPSVQEINSVWSK